MKKFAIQILINMVGVYLTYFLLKGIYIFPNSDSALSIFWLALIIALVNTFIKPIVKVVGCPFIILTFGLGSLLINTLMFYLAGLIGRNFGVGFTVSGFWGAFFGALIVTMVNMILSGLLQRDN